MDSGGSEVRGKDKDVDFNHHPLQVEIRWLDAIFTERRMVVSRQMFYRQA